METRTCIIVDDEPAAHYVLTNHIGKVQRLKLVKQCYDGFEAINYLREHPVDLMFLDINMPEITGLEILKSLKNPPYTILCTAYSEFALESYEYGVIDYLLKPVYFPRFLVSVDRFFNLYTIAPAGDSASSITLRIDAEPVTIEYKDLLFTQSFGNYVKIHTAERYYLATMTTNDLENALPAPRFSRIHKSFIVAIDKIDDYGKDYIQVGTVRMPIGITYRQKLMDLMRTK